MNDWAEIHCPIFRQQKDGNKFITMTFSGPTHDGNFSCCYLTFDDEKEAVLFSLRWQ